MDDKITIIEGPTPNFETISDGWALGLDETPLDYDLAITHVRTFNGPALVERCHRAWSSQGTIYLHYRNRLGLEETAPILAARNMETPEGHVLVLWCRLNGEDTSEEWSSDDENDGFGSR